MCRPTLLQRSQELLSDILDYFSVARPSSQDHAQLQGRLGNMASILGNHVCVKNCITRKEGENG